MKKNDGKQYGVPLTVDTRILFYNKDPLRKPGESGGNQHVGCLKEPPQRQKEMQAEAGTVRFSLSDPGLFNNWILRRAEKWWMIR